MPKGTAASVIEAETHAYEMSQARLQSLRAAVAAADASEDREGYREAVEALQKGQAVEFASISEQRHQVALAKVPAVIAHLTDQVEQGKVICFAHHLDVVAAIHDAFPGSVVVTGQTSLEARQQAVDTFQNDPNCRLFVGNIRAAGVGLTLTASSHVVFAELDWTPANLSQAEDRAHRIGQHDSVLVQHLVLEGSLDASMAQMLIAKQEVIDRSLDTGDAPIIETAKIETAPAPSNVTKVDVSGLNGGYAVQNESGNLTFLLFDSPVEKWAGWTFVRQQVGANANRLGKQRPGGTYEGPWEALIAKVVADPRTAMETYGKELGICGACMSPLTNAESRAAGLGPICRAKRGW